MKKPPTAAVLAIGHELLQGATDTNGPAIENRLAVFGIEPALRMVLPDDQRQVALAVKAAMAQHDLVICCGGLGPTQDDVTRQAVAEALGRDLVLRPEWLRPVTAWFRRMRREMPAINRVQAMLPRGSQPLINRWGTAQGFLVGDRGRWIAALPGPPRECLPMLEHTLWPRLRRLIPRAARRPVTIRMLRTTGVAESKLQEMLGPLFPAGTAPELGFLLDEPGEIFVKLTWRGPAASQSREAGRAVNRIVKILGDNVVDPAGRSLPETVGRMLRAQRQTLAVAESCTGGLIASRLTSIAGSSRYFVEAAVTYSNASKTRRLQVPAALLRKKGAVSAQTAAVMAQGIRRTSGADWGLAVTGIAGPGGGTRRKPVGLVYLAVSGPAGHSVQDVRLTGDRRFIQQRTATLALDLLRRALLSNSGGNRHA